MVSSLLQFAQRLHHAGRLVRPEPRHRLVEQQHPRLGGQRHRKLDLAVLAVAHAGDHGVGAMADADALERRARGLAQLGSSARASRQKWNEWPAWACTASATFSQRGEVRKQRRDLERAREPEQAAVIDRQRGDVLSVEHDAAGVRDDLAGELADQRGLAGAVRADDGLQLARHHVERDIVGGDHAAEALGQALDLEQRVSHGRTSRAGCRCRRARRARSAAASGRGSAASIPSPPRSPCR